MGFLLSSVRKETSQAKLGMGLGQTSACFTADMLHPVFQLVPKNQTAGNKLGKATRVLLLATKGEKIKITRELPQR